MMKDPERRAYLYPGTHAPRDRAFGCQARHRLLSRAAEPMGGNSSKIAPETAAIMVDAAVKRVEARVENKEAQIEKQAAEMKAFVEKNGSEREAMLVGELEVERARVLELQEQVGEAMEESLWRSRVIEKVDTKYAKLWADELMIAQVKDWYRRENGLRWRGSACSSRPTSRLPPARSCT